MDNSEPQQQHPQSYLFTVRLWIETVNQDQDEVRMQVKHLLSDETCYFRNGQLLLAYLLLKVREFEQARRSRAERL